MVEAIGASVRVHSNVIFSQIDLHSKFGGIVPEVASRNHLDMIAHVVEEALLKSNCSFNDLKAIAVTQGPGLMGALLVGISYAKALAYQLKIPLVPVNHLEGHLHSLFIKDDEKTQLPDLTHLPLLVCLVSGGHTNLYLVKNLPPKKLMAEKISESRDDAAGEAFDKTAKLLGLPYPGGVHMDRLAKDGNKLKYDFPRPLPGKKNLEFSFSGLKTAVLVELKKQGYLPHIFGKVEAEKLPHSKELADFCASIQEAIVQTLIRKIKIGIKEFNAKGFAIVGGVSANSRLRELITKEVKVPVFIPDQKYCTDNAAMIGASAVFQEMRNEILNQSEMISLNAYSS